MKWTYILQQRLKIAGLLWAIMTVLILFNLILQKNITEINRSVRSIYNDRLVPATDIFYLSENLHNKQLVMEKFLYQENYNPAQLKLILTEHNKNIQSLVKKFENTFLVDQESFFLKQFKKQILAYSAIEENIISLGNTNKIEALKLYETEGVATFNTTKNHLFDLTTIQSTVGNKLLKDTQGTVNLSTNLSDIQLILAIIIGAIITSLIVKSRIVDQPQAKFKWN